MSTAIIEFDFKAKVSDQVRLAPEGNDRYRVFVPFRFDDGDRFCIVLKRHRGGWVLSDEGNTFMRLSYSVADLEQGTRKKVIDKTIANFGVEDTGDELLLPIDGEGFGDALFSFVQALIHISDVTYLNKEIVRSTFMEDLVAVVEKAVPSEKREFNWSALSDPTGNYPVDCRIEGNGVPLFLFGIPNDDKCNLATIVILHHKTNGVRFKSLAVFQDQVAIGRKQVARLSDAVDKQFSSLETNVETVAEYLSEWASHELQGVPLGAKRQPEAMSADP